MKHGILIDKINVENWYAQIQKGLKDCNYDTGINILLNYLLQEIEIAITNAPAAMVPFEEIPDGCFGCMVSSVFIETKDGYLFICDKLNKTIGEGRDRPCNCPIVTKE